MLWHLVFGALGPLLVVMLVGLGAGVVFERKALGPAERLLRVAVIVGLSIMLLAMAVPVKAVAQLILFAFERAGERPSPIARFFIVSGRIDVFLGAAALLQALMTLATIGRTWTRLARVQNLPTAKARSAALGLVELEGKVRRAPDGEAKRQWSTAGPAVDWKKLIPDGAVIYKGSHSPDGGVKQATCQLHTPFFLEDASGRILIDPRGADFGGFSTEFVFGEPAARLALEKDRLLDGDPVYVLGTVEVRRDASPGAVDSDRVVVRAAPEQAMSARRENDTAAQLRRWVRGRRSLSFFLASGREADARKGLDDSFVQTFVSALILLAAALSLLTTALGNR